MRRFLLVLFILCGITLSAMAQDVIVLKNTNEIQAKVKSIGLNEVVYLRWDNLDGPTYTLLKSDIIFIQYANGLKDTFVQVKPANNEFLTKRVQGYAYLGADFSSVAGGPSIDFGIGARFSKYLYVGGGVGWHNLIRDVFYQTQNRYVWATAWMNYFNLTADIKAYIPTKSNFYPRFDLSVGPTLGGIYESYYGDYAFGVGFYMSTGAGFDYKNLSLGAGFQMPILGGEVLPQGYVRIGVRFGNRN